MRSARPIAARAQVSASGLTTRRPGKNDSMRTSAATRGYLRSGALAGAASAVIFAIVHHVFISDIWYSLPMMTVAGSVCGLCVAWTYQLLFEVRSALSFVRYNMVYVAMFVLLGAASLLVYDPVTTIAAMAEANEPPVELIGRAMPMTVLFTLGTATLLSVLYGRTRGHFDAILLTCTVLIVLLGLNVSVIGLVDIPSESLYLVAELFGLIVVINLAYVASFIVLERKSLAGERAAPAYRPACTSSSARRRA